MVESKARDVNIGFPNIESAHIADAKVDYTTGDLVTEADIIAAINATNTKINLILLVLETQGLTATS
jgi:hypothetical protein